MANEQNLIPNSERTPRERRERAHEMGIASGVSRRRKKTIIQIMDAIDRLPLNEIGKADLKRGGLDLSYVDPDDLNGAYGIVAGMYISARRGNHKAFEALTRYREQQKKDRLEIEKLKAEIEKYKLMNGSETGAAPDDGFLDALNSAGAKDWEGYDADKERSAGSL